MTDFSVFSAESGAFMFRCQAGSADLPALIEHYEGQGHTCLPDTGPLPPGCYLQDGVPTDPPPQPTPNHVFDYSAKQWVDPRTLDEVKAAQWTAIKAARAAHELGGFVWGGSQFDSDQVSQQRIQGAVQLAQLAMAAGQPFEVDWTLADNSTRTLSATDVLQVGMALGGHITAAHTKARALRAAINAATTADAVQTTTW